MNDNQYCYTFSKSVDIVEVQATATLALLATESLHGESRTRLELRHAFDPVARTCVIDATGGVGRDFNRLFLGFVSREFGRDSFRVEEVDEFKPVVPAA